MMLDWSLVLAIATFSLAGAAFWAIWQNYISRKEDRELSIKIQALDEISGWANNLLQAVMNIYARDESFKLELKQRLQTALSVEVSILTLAQIFGGTLEEKVNTANKSVSKLQKTLFSMPDVEGEGFFSMQNKKHQALLSESVSSLDDLLEVVCKTRINLFLQDKDTKNIK